MSVLIIINQSGARAGVLQGDGEVPGQQVGRVQHPPDQFDGRVRGQETCWNLVWSKYRGSGSELLLEKVLNWNYPISGVEKTLQI